MRDEPAYVSLTAPRVSWNQNFVLQRKMSPCQLLALARALPDLKIPQPDPEDPRGESSALQGSLERLGLAETRDSILDGATAPAPADFHKTKWIGEDLGIAVFDPEHRRMFMEEFRHRYLIRGEDVTCFWPLLAQNIISIRINYRIGDETLSRAVTRANPLAHVSGGMFTGRGVKKLVSSLADALGFEPQAEAEGQPDEIA